MSDDRRRFTRVPFDAVTRLQQNDWSIPVHLVDISLRGLLVTQPAEWDASRNTEPFVAVIDLDEGSEISMEIRLMHCENGLLGFRCDHTDLDSVSHLRRLLALNLGDADLLDRELAALL